MPQEREDIMKAIDRLTEQERKNAIACKVKY